MKLEELAKRSTELRSELQELDVVFPYEWDYFMKEIDDLLEALRQEPLTFSTDKT